MLTLFFLFLLLKQVTAYQQCPQSWSNQPLYHDLVILADVVSWNNDYQLVKGDASFYKCMYEKEGKYDTRMRVYQSYNNETILVFRPTQSTDEGGQIHVNRVLTNCLFLNQSCQGMVHQRFQEAFLSLSENMPSIQNSSSIYVVGHSLGGSLALFMALYLYHVLRLTPISVIGLAGPFIGDEKFSELYLPLFEDSIWFQVEAINSYNLSEYDGTVEGYNVDKPPYIYIDQHAICTVTVPKKEDSYGMHDLKNYMEFFNGHS